MKCLKQPIRFGLSRCIFLVSLLTVLSLLPTPEDLLVLLPWSLPLLFVFYIKLLLVLGALSGSTAHFVCAFAKCCVAVAN